MLRSCAALLRSISILNAKSMVIAKLFPVAADRLIAILPRLVHTYAIAIP